MSSSPAAVLPAAAGPRKRAHDPELHRTDEVPAQATPTQTEEILGSEMDLDVPEPTGQNPVSGVPGAPEAVARRDLDLTTKAPDSTPIAAGTVDGSMEAGQAEPATTSTVTPTQSRETAPIPIPSAREADTPSETCKQNTGIASTDAPPQLNPSNPTGTEARGGGRAMFGSNPTGGSRRRRVMANTNALTAYEADLTDQDRAKQKEAVRRYLSERVKADWQWQWPAVQDPDTSRAGSSVADHDAVGDVTQLPDELWKERDEWPSGVSEGEGPSTAVSALRRDSQPQSPRDDVFQFSSPEQVSSTIRKNERDRKRRNKKRLAEEMAWNDGMRCFIQRRDAWTGARHVTAAEPSSLTHTSTNRSSASAPAALPTDLDPPDTDSEWDWATEIPVAGPILPPENAMRASITPAAYNTIYDKVVLQQLTPSCPMNLKDVTRSCVQGWKRDGEWPPKSVEVPKKKGRRMSIVSLFSLDKGDERKEKEKEKEKERREPEGAAAPAEGEKGKGPGPLGKGIRKMLFWKDKDHGPGACKGREFSPSRGVP